MRFALLSLVSLAAPAFAQLPPGGDGYAFPPGGKAGTTVDVRLGGADWTPDVRFFVHDPRLKLEVLTKPGEVLMPDAPYWMGNKSMMNDPRLPREVTARFTLPANLPTGLVHWSVANAGGGGTGGVFAVGNDAEVTEVENRKGPQELPALPVAVNGRIGRIEETDAYRFTATATGPVTCELLARRLGNDLHGVIEVRDAGGKKIAEAVDTEGVDPVVTFAAEKGKAYVVAVRDIDFRGYRNFTYRLAATPGPRVVACVPAAGKRGAKQSVEFVGVGIATGKAVLESVTKEVAFPADPALAAFGYVLETPFGKCPAVSIPLSDTAEQLEPADKKLAVPAAVTGRIRTRGERVSYTAAGKKGDVWQLAVMARRIGSPVEPTLTVTGPDGKPVAVKDEPEGNGDVRASLTLPADGDYQLAVADGSGKPPAADAVYRLSLAKPAPGFTLTTDGIVNIPIGGKGVMTVRIRREGGVKEPVALAITGLPAGIILPKEMTVPPTAETLAVSLDCPKDAAALSALVEVVGTAKIDGRDVKQAARGTLRGDLAPRDGDANRVPQVLVSTTMKPPFKVKVAEADGGRRIPRGSTHLSEMLVERLDGFKGEIVLDMAGAQQRHRQGIRGPSLIVPPTAAKIDYPVFLPEWLETTRTSRIGLIAMALVPDPKGTPRYVLAPVEGQVTMSIEGALMKLSVGVPELTAVVGRPLELPLKLFRSQQVPDAVTVELIVPDELRTFIDAKPLAWPKGKPAADWRIEVRDDAKLIGVHKFTARAIAKKGGHPVVSETTFEVEFVAAPPK